MRGWCKSTIGTNESCENGANPQPGAWTIFENNELKIFDCAKVNLNGVPGKVLEITEDSFTIGTKGGGVKIKRVRPHNDKKISAADFIANSGIIKGAYLET